MRSSRLCRDVAGENGFVAEVAWRVCEHGPEGMGDSVGVEFRAGRDLAGDGDGAGVDAGWGKLGVQGEGEVHLREVASEGDDLRSDAGGGYRNAAWADVEALLIQQKAQAP